MDIIERLERLQKLRDSDVLTKSEFEAQKRLVLGSEGLEGHDVGQRANSLSPDEPEDSKTTGHRRAIFLIVIVALLGVLAWVISVREDISILGTNQAVSSTEADHSPAEPTEISFDTSDFNVYNCGKDYPVFLYFNSQLLDKNMEMPYHIVKNGKEVTTGYSILGSKEIAFNAMDITLDYDDLKILDADDRGILLKFVGTNERIFVYRNNIPVQCTKVENQ